MNWMQLSIQLGKSVFGLVTDVTNEELAQMTHLQLTNVYKLVNLALPAMIRRRTGGVVIISSIWGQIGASCEVFIFDAQGRAKHLCEGDSKRSRAKRYPGKCCCSRCD
ncbi:hypothetical protein GCM10020331_048970 [Ectobacillus funiculus]